MEAKKIMLPTDFSVKSLNLVREAIEISNDEVLEIILVHGYQLPNHSITDMLFFSKARELQKLQTVEFLEAINLIENKYTKRIKRIIVDLITTTNRSYLNDYVQKLGIEEIFVPEGFPLSFEGENSFNPSPLLKQCQPAITLMDYSTAFENSFRVTKQVSDIFFTSHPTI
ncbi:hypothetical protein BXY85_0135 [Roseivirga pacifica]|uniref:UspA domain-containing protein n=1 Tax=Roseivirga pacifica TaxID=1267423 RepID=A0A1I0R7S5_9BACT|nr:universal stress protein [Roseivirga pacifica]RKQ49147.1 hypothetical protein BXY85_0135 [Roseivirga pacifica]SEW36515.1 hypothetical protein SAMN05216290_3188 [Roseivirga pacifica]